MNLFAARRCRSVLRTREERLSNRLKDDPPKARSEEIHFLKCGNERGISLHPIP